MSASSSVTARIEGAVDPATAFAVFTEEIGRILTQVAQVSTQ